MPAGESQQVRGKAPRRHQTRREEGPWIDFVNRQRKHVISEGALRRLAGEVMKALHHSNRELSITFVGLAAMRRLNHQYRQKDKPTDVLSFPDPFEGLTPGTTVAETYEWRSHLGDVVIAPEVARRQAARAGIPFRREMQFLLLHGVLHLCGYDHETDHGEMERLERRLRVRLIGGAGKSGVRTRAAREVPGSGMTV